MTMIKTIFRQEWRQFMRQQWMPAALMLFSAVSLLAIQSGKQTVNLRQIQIDSINTSYRHDLEVHLAKFTDTSGPKAKTEAANAGLAAIVNYRLPQNLIKEPTSLSGLSIGLMDIMPWYEQVKFVRSYNDQAVVPVSNPLVLFSGNFDYAFVLIYLMPLLVIAFCYAVYDTEKTAGTIPLLAVQSGKVQQVIRYKLLFRFILIGAMILMLNICAFAFASTNNKLSLSFYLWWVLLSVLYAGTWFFLCWAIISLKKSGAITALYLSALWMFLLLITPSLTNAYVQASYPLPMKDEIAAYRRHQSEEIWGGSAKVLSDSFNRYNPRYASSIDPAKDTLRLSNRYIAGYYDLLEKRVMRVMIPYENALAKRNHLGASLLSWNPALRTQAAFANLASNDQQAFRQFREQSDSFQKRWQAFLYDFHFAEKNLTESDLRSLPVFRQPAVKTDHIAMFTTCMILTGVIVILSIWAVKNEPR